MKNIAQFECDVLCANINGTVSIASTHIVIYTAANMSKARFLMAMIGLLMIMSVEVHGIPMIPSCPAIIFYETAKLINKGFTEVKDQGATLNGTVNRISGTVSQMHEDLAEVKYQGSLLNQTVTQIQEELTNLAGVKKQVSALNGTVNQIHEDLMEMKNLLASLQQTVGAFDSSNLCEYKTLYSHTSIIVSLVYDVSVSVNIHRVPKNEAPNFGSNFVKLKILSLPDSAGNLQYRAE